MPRYVHIISEGIRRWKWRRLCVMFFLLLSVVHLFSSLFCALGGSA